MCHQILILCPCATCTSPTADASVGVYYEFCDETRNLTLMRRHLYGEERVDVAGEAERHTEVRCYSRGCAWDGELDGGVREDRRWECEKSGCRFVEDGEAKRSEVPGEAGIPDGVV